MRNTVAFDLTISILIIAVPWLLIGIPAALYFPMRTSNFSEDPTASFSHVQKTALEVAPIPASIISILSAIVLFIFYCMYPSLQNFLMRIIALYMSATDLVNNCAILLYKFIPSMCPYQSAITQWANLSKLMWNWCLCFCIFELIVQKRRLKQLAKYELAFIVLTCFVPLGFATAVLAGGLYGPYRIYGWYV